MTREKKKLIIRKAHNNIDNPLRELDCAVDEMFDYFEARLKAKDEHIALLQDVTLSLMAGIKN